MKCLVTLLLLVFILYGCSQERVKPSIMKNLKVEEVASNESWNSTVIFSDSGVTKAVLYAGRIRMYDKAQETLLDSSIRVDFYDYNEVKTTVLTAKRGKVDDVSKNLFAYENVVVVNDSSETTLKTEKLMWRNDDRRIVSDERVKITSPKETIEGIGFESDQSLKNYTIYKIIYITNSDSL